MSIKCVIDESDKDADVAVFHFGEPICSDPDTLLKLSRTLDAAEGVDLWTVEGNYSLRVKKARLFRWDTAKMSVVAAVLASTDYQSLEYVNS